MTTSMLEPPQTQTSWWHRNWKWLISVLVRELGTPIETGWQFTGSIKINGPSGSADFGAPLHGPHGRGTLYVTATKSADL